MPDESTPTTDSGLSELSISEEMNRDLSPTINTTNATNTTNDHIEEEDEELDETLSERLWGLTEMFPECVRNGFYNVSNGSLIGVKYLYGFSRSALWVLFTSSAILLAPLALELERSQMEEYSRQQQRQILLGPSAALSSGPHGMAMPPPLQPPQQRSI